MEQVYKVCAAKKKRPNYWNLSKRSECEVQVNEGKEEVSRRRREEVEAELRGLRNENSRSRVPDQPMYKNRTPWS